MATHIHLDLVGGLSGDMFISAMLDAFPDLGGDLGKVIEQAGFPDLVSLNSEPFNDGILTGTRFTVAAATQESHHHRHYSEIRDTLNHSGLDARTKQGALAMFHEIAVVEAAIHGKAVESVAFHEVGAWDSIADIVLASHLISCVDATWSISGIPAGSGFVETAHGRLPVPAPATARLLEGFALIDDGIDGERVTPTGAVIIRYLEPALRRPDGAVLQRTGYGFGTKKFPGISNTVRVSVFEMSTQESSGLPKTWLEDTVMRLSFELDDLTPEALAQAVVRLRALDGVLDLTEQMVAGKKGRHAASLVLLVRPDYSDSVTAQCFDLTPTLGVRREEIRRAILPREEVVVFVRERQYRVKVAKRPSGYTAKVEMDDLIAEDLSPREQDEIRDEAEALAIRQVEKTDS